MQSIPECPAQIADLAHELWQRAAAAAVVELKGGPAARLSIHRDEEMISLQAQVGALRDQLQRESLAYGELRAEAARHEAVARLTLARADAPTKRERQLLRELGSAHQRVVELDATIEPLRASAAGVDSQSLPRSPAKPKMQPSAQRPASPTNRTVRVVRKVRSEAKGRRRASARRAGITNP